MAIIINFIRLARNGIATMILIKYPTKLLIENFKQNTKPKREINRIPTLWQWINIYLTLIYWSFQGRLNDKLRAHSPASKKDTGAAHRLKER